VLPRVPVISLVGDAVDVPVPVVVVTVPVTPVFDEVAPVSLPVTWVIVVVLPTVPVISVVADAVGVPVPVVPVVVGVIPVPINPVFDEVAPVSLPVI
jgi:hypothetical protein